VEKLYQNRAKLEQMAVHAKELEIPDTADRIWKVIEGLMASKQGK